MTRSVSSPAPPSGVMGVRYPRVVMAAMIAGATAVLGCTTGLFVVTPLVARTLHATQAQLELIIDVTIVALGALVLPCGALLDRYGRRRGLIVGFTGLLVTLAVTIIVRTPAEMLAARLATGVFAAIALPGTLATLTATTPREKHGLAVGGWAAGMVSGGIYGVLVGGIFGQAGNWQLLPIGLGIPVAVCLACTLFAVPETSDPEHANLDPPGSLLSLIGVGGVTFAVIEMPVRDITDPLVLASLIVGLLSCVLFVAWELRTPTPMLDVRLFSSATFASATGGAFLLFFASFGWFFLSFQYNAYVLGYGPLASAACLIPSGITTVPFAVLGPGLAKRFGWRALVSLSMLVSAIAFLIMGLGGQDLALWPIIVGGLIFGVGLGLAQGPVTEAIVLALPAAQQGLASAVNDASRELGSAFGIAVFGSVFNAAYRASITSHTAHLPAQLFTQIKNSPALGLQAIAHANDHDHPLHQVIRTATGDGWTDAFLVGAAIWLAAAALIYTRGPTTILPAGEQPHRR